MALTIACRIYTTPVDSTVAGEVFVRIADMMHNGEKITDGMTIEGMGKVQVDAQQHTILGNATESLDKQNLPKLVKMGL